MGIINILIISLSYCYGFNAGIYPKHINKNIIMKQDDFNFLNKVINLVMVLNFLQLKPLKILQLNGYMQH